MSDVRLASLGLAVAFSASLMMLGCGDSTTSCDVPTDRTADGGAPAAPDVRPPQDAALARDTATSTPGANGTLGATCTASTGCATGLTCLRPADNMTGGQGPANGLCTRDCTADVGNAGCQTYGGSCVLFNEAPERAYCIESCQLTSSAVGKCHGRGDVFCQGLTNEANMVVLQACIPSCTDDADCAGRRCDLGSGLCGDQPSTGRPTGSPCTGDIDCIGKLCLDASSPEATASVGVCSGYCRFGGTEGCGYRRTGPVNDTGGACAVAVQTPQADGDFGYCVELCDSNADCALKHPDFGCFTAPLFVSKWGHGVCLPGAALGAADAGRDAATVEAGRDASGLDAAREAAVDSAANAAEATAPESATVVDAGVDAAALDAAADAGTD